MDEVARVASDKGQVVGLCNSSDLAIDVGRRASLSGQPCALLGVPERGFAVIRQDHQREQHPLQIAEQLPLARPVRHPGHPVTQFVEDRSRRAYLAAIRLQA